MLTGGIDLSIASTDTASSIVFTGITQADEHRLGLGLVNSARIHSDARLHEVDSADVREAAIHHFVGLARHYSHWIPAPLELLKCLDHSGESPCKTVVMLALEIPVALSELLYFFVCRGVRGELFSQWRSDARNPLFIGWGGKSPLERVMNAFEEESDRVYESSIEVEENCEWAMRLHCLKLTSPAYDDQVEVVDGGDERDSGRRHSDDHEP
jgi:hypothetical protein